MKCPKCETELSTADVHVIGIAPPLRAIPDGQIADPYDEYVCESLDIIVVCPKCMHTRNGFIPECDLIDMEA